MESDYSVGLDIQDGVLHGLGACTDKDLVIPNGVVEIKEEALLKCTSIESIAFPDSLKKIGACAFRDCSNLTKVTFGKASQLEFIGFVAFADTAIKEFISPDSLQVIERAVFADCANLKVFSFPKNFKKLESEVFRGCGSLSDIYIDDLASFCNIEFEYNSNPLGYADKLYIEGKLTKEILFPDEITTISNYAFNGCALLESISFGENSNLTAINEFAFYRCSKLKSVVLPKSLKKLGSCAFCRCESLNELNLPENIEYIGSEILGNCYVTEFTIPKNTKKVINRVFLDCKGLVKVTLPNTISYDTYYDRPSYTFGTFFNKIDHSLNSQYVPLSIKHIVFTGDIGVADSAFSNCGNIETIEIIGKSDVISQYAFHNLQCLVSVKLPNTIKEIGHHAFLSCDALKYIIFEGTKQEWENIKKDYAWFPYKNPYTIQCSDGDIIVNG